MRHKDIKYLAERKGPGFGNPEERLIRYCGHKPAIKKGYKMFFWCAVGCIMWIVMYMYYTGE